MELRAYSVRMARWGRTGEALLKHRIADRKRARRYQVSRKGIGKDVPHGRRSPGTDPVPPDRTGGFAAFETRLFQLDVRRLGHVAPALGFRLNGLGEFFGGVADRLDAQPLEALQDCRQSGDAY